MRSRVLSVKSYRDIETAIQPFVLDEAALEYEVRRLANPFIRWEEADEVEQGGLAVCRLVSECPRFNKEKVKFAVGSGMFHKELEALTVGMKAGETRETDLPEGHVALTVTAATRRIVPEPTDEMAAALGLEGVSDLASYRTYLAGQQKEKYLEAALYEPVQHLMETVLAESEFVICKEDWSAVVEQKLERSRVLCRQEDMVLEEMTAEQFKGRIPVKSYHEFIALLQNTAWDTLRMHLLGQYYAQEDGFTVSEAGYEAYIEDYVNFWRATPEQAREVDPYESYRFNEYASHAYEVFSQYIKNQF